MKYLVVFEDTWRTKVSKLTDHIGDTIEELLAIHGATADYDKEKKNSDNPYDMFTFGPGFYDIDAEDSEGSLVGRIMIFDVQEDTPNELFEDDFELPVVEEEESKYAILDPSGIIVNSFTTLEEANMYLDYMSGYHSSFWLGKCSVVGMDAL